MKLQPRTLEHAKKYAIRTKTHSGYRWACSSPFGEPKHTIRTHTYPALLEELQRQFEQLDAQRWRTRILHG